jgi:sorbitol-specific phosphotransferase system component IIBC
MKKNSQAFVNQLLVCLLVTIGFGGSIGVGTVYMRHQISVTADTNRRLAAEIAAVERLITEKTTTVETELRADVLRRLNQGDRRLGLVPMSDVPIIHVTEDPAGQMLERAASRAPLPDRPGPIVIRFAQR